MTWRTALLGQHVDILSGFAFKSNLFNTEGVGFPLVRIRDVVPGQSTTYYNGPFDKNYFVENGDILIGMDGEFNRAQWLGGRALLNQRVCKISVSNNLLDAGYLFHFLPEALKEIEERTPFVTVKHLSAKDIRGIQIPLPPLAEQRRIAAILDQADALRRKRREALTNLNYLGQSLLREMLDSGDLFENNKLGDICVVSTGSTPKREYADYYEGAIPWVKTTEVAVGELINDTEEKVTDAGMRAARLKLFPRNSIVVAMYGQGTTRGKVAKLGIDATVNQACAVLLPNGRIDATYLMQVLTSSYERLRELGRGGNQPNLNLDLVRQFEVPVPHIDLQRAFAARVAEIDKLKTAHRAHLEKLDDLFVVLQHRAFRGELTVVAQSVKEFA